MIIGAIVVWVGVAILVFVRLKRYFYDKFFKSVIIESRKLYLCGLKLKRYFDGDALLRFQAWTRGGMCYELSAIVMILLKGHKSARICRGFYHDKKQGFTSRHAWVEVKVPLNGWYVIDLAWMYPAFCEKKNYWRHRLEGDLTCEWVCKYRDFWKIRFPNVLREAMQNSLTSHVLLEFSVFGNPDEDYEFDPILYELDKLRFTDGKLMIPFRRECSDNPISSRILREFVMNPKREQPKAKSIRRANAAIKLFWIEEKAVP